MIPTDLAKFACKWRHPMNGAPMHGKDTAVLPAEMGVSSLPVWFGAPLAAPPCPQQPLAAGNQHQRPWQSASSLLSQGETHEM